MKIIKTIGHPVLVMSMFLLILISGEHLGGVYLFYILLGLPYGAPHSIIALTGLATIFIGYKIYRSKPNILKHVLYVVGIAVMILALITFFERSRGYNDSTFSQTASLISLGLFSLCAFCCIIQSVWMAAKIYKNKNDKLGIAS